jgi:predicted flap endonuclease-1-like 5' DNA nuclease
VTALSGRAGWYVDQLRIHTNQRVSDAFGGDGADQEFQLDVPPGHAFVGLHGCADWYIDSVGVVSRSVALGSVEPAPEAEPVAEPESSAPAREARPKDLEKIEGIGPKIAALLVSNGILDLGDLAAAPVAQVKEILAAAGARYAIADPSTWPEQAALGARGDWEGMAALQKQLKGGRRA